MKSLVAANVTLQMNLMQQGPLKRWKVSLQRQFEISIPNALKKGMTLRELRPCLTPTKSYTLKYQARKLRHQRNLD